MKPDELLDFVKECARHWNRPASMFVEFSIDYRNNGVLVRVRDRGCCHRSDNTKTIVKAENETFDPEKGLAMAITKKALGNEGNYYNELKKYLGDDYETKF